MAGDGITIRQLIAAPAFHQFLAARAYYVMARVAILSQTHGGPEVLLSQQTIEFYIKAIRRQKGDPSRGHDLVKLLKRMRPPRPPYFDSILRDRAKKRFLTTLSTAYDPGQVRYRESGYGINPRDTTAHLDELVFNLDRAFRSLQPEARRRFFAVRELQPFFLAGNGFFTDDDVTDNWLAATAAMD